MENDLEYTFTDREILLSIANKQSFDCAKIDQLLQSIYAPAELKLIIPICGNLVNIILTARNHSDTLTGVDYQNWLEACQFIVANKASLKLHIGNHLSYRTRKNKRHRLYGYLSTHPIYSALLNTHEPDTQLNTHDLEVLSTTYQLLQAQVLIAHADYMLREKPNAHMEAEYSGYDAIDNSANEVGRLLRKLSETKGWYAPTKLDT